MQLADALGEALGRGVRSLRGVSGGDLNDAYAVELEDGGRVFVKTSPDAAPHAYEREAEGLRWLAEPDALPVAVPLVATDRFLALEWIDSAPRAADFEERLGRGLAKIHRTGADRFGASEPTALGPLELPNAEQGGHSRNKGDSPPCSAGPRNKGDRHLCSAWGAFYVSCRLEPLARMAHQRGNLPAEAPALLERLAVRIDELAGPPEPPARIHGDLWGGNVMANSAGHPVLIDPAAYGGHREIDLAMLRLFGGPGPAFLAAYHEAYPLAPGHEERTELWQILPLLVHAVLFGGGYGASAVAAMRRYVG